MSNRPYHPVSISQLQFWEASAEQRDQSFRVLRDECPVSWHAPLEGTLLVPQQQGLWAVVRHADIVRVSRDTQTFSSAHGVMQEEMPEDILEAAQSFIGMDPPRHTRMRKLVSAAFTPRQLAKIELQIKAQAERIVTDLLEQRECDFVSQVSTRLPNWTIYEMMGLPREQREAAAQAAEGMVAWNDPAVATGRDASQVLSDSLVHLLRTGMELAEARRAKPADDIMTNLVQAEVEGQRLSDEEIGAFFVLLSVGGNDTTRSTISIAAKALADHPKQKQLLAADFERHSRTAIDEFLRWASPVMTFRRTVLADIELHGQHISAGEWVVLCYASGNRDERVFEDPQRFDITRQPNLHISFGGGGPHHCMGAMLAKVQLRALFEQLLRRAPHLELGEPRYLVSNFVRGIRSLPCSVR